MRSNAATTWAPRSTRDCNVWSWAACVAVGTPPLRLEALAQGRHFRAGRRVHHHADEHGEDCGPRTRAKREARPRRHPRAVEAGGEATVHDEAGNDRQQHRDAHGGAHAPHETLDEPPTLGTRGPRGRKEEQGAEHGRAHPDDACHDMHQAQPDHDPPPVCYIWLYVLYSQMVSTGRFVSPRPRPGPHPRRYRLGRRQAAVARTPARILRAARALLVAPHGVAFSLDAVARRARVTRATVYH